MVDSEVNYSNADWAKNLKAEIFQLDLKDLPVKELATRWQEADKKVVREWSDSKKQVDAVAVMRR